MKEQYISDLVPGEEVKTTFLVHRKDVKEKRDGELYLSFMLGDKTGLVDAIMWNNIGPAKDTVKQDDFVNVTGRAGTFKDKIQITLNTVKKRVEDSVDYADFLPASAKDPQVMMKELKGILDEVKETHMRQLLDSFLKDGEFLKSFLNAPAAVAVHHAFLGGLLEHTLNVAKASAGISRVYPDIDKDLLLCGAFLHDIGKIIEYEYRRRIDFSDEGQLKGHLVIGHEMMMAKIAKIGGFPDELALKLGHMILSHHGEYLR